MRSAAMENAEEVSGVNVNRSKLKIYTLAGLMYGLAGFLLAAKSGGAWLTWA